MINNINDGAIRNVSKVDPIGTIHEQAFVQQKSEEIRKARPVEKSDAGSQTKETKNKGEDSSKYVLDENKLVYEKYDQHGELILRIPPAYKPVDERA
jgi:hypothetical protein